jgi:hypothetical protein
MISTLAPGSRTIETSLARTASASSVQLKPADPTINDHLGDIYWKTDRKLEALFQWNHARDLGPEPEDLPKILEKIERGLSEDKNETAAPASMPAETPAKNGGL